MNHRLGLLLAIALPLAACASDRDAETRAHRIVKPGSLPDFSYALVAKGGDMKVGAGHSDDWERIQHHEAAPSGEYLWFKQGGQDYVITDAALIAQARAAMRPMLDVGERMNAIGERMSEHGEVLSQYGEAMAERGRREADEALSAVAADEPPVRPVPPAEEEEAEARMEEASEAMSALSKDIEALNERHERAAAKTEAQVHALAQEALASGRARPLAR